MREIERLQRGGASVGKKLRSQARAGASYEAQRDFIVDGITRLGIARSAAARVVRQHGAAGIVLRPTTLARASRLGGDALVAEDSPWPTNRRSGRPLSMVATLDLAELRVPAPLPPDGTLVLYYDGSGPDVDLTDAWLDIAANAEVRWIPPGMPVASAKAPNAALSFPPQPVAGTPMYIVGGIGDRGYGVPGRRSADRAFEALFGLGGTAYPGDQVLGASQDIQGPVMDEFAYWFKETSSPATRSRFTAQERKGVGWTLIAQISGAGSLAMMFGDGGHVSFAVPTADLLARRFDRAVAIMQSG